MARKARPKAERRATYIRNWRKHRGLTLVQMSDRLLTELEIEIDHSQLSRIERGESPYNQDILEAFAKILRCEPQDLLIRDPLAPEPIWSIWETLAPAERRQAVEVIKALKRTGTEG